MHRRVLLHPDVFFTGHSGAIAAREAERLLTAIGCEVAVFTHDPPGPGQAEYRVFPRLPYTGTAHYFGKRYRESLQKVIEAFRPDFMFFIGGIINTPVAYPDLCREKGVKTVFMLLVQDFFCARLHAALGTGSCTRCLQGSGLPAFWNHCGEKQSRPWLYLANYQVVRRLIAPGLRKMDYVLGSSDEQLSFYARAGVAPDRVRKIPLFFDQRRVKATKAAPGGYFVIIGQLRHEKGAHLVCRILDELRPGIRIKMIFFDDREAAGFLERYPGNRRHLESGKLELLPGVTMTRGAVELIAGSAGVINPSVWATTTEFVLLEVLGMGKPHICFDVGIHREVIRNRVNGICVPAGDFKAMADEIHSLADHPEAAAAIAPGAGELFHRLTDDESFTGILTSIFHS